MYHCIAGEFSLLATFRLIKALCNVLYSSKLGRYLSRQYLFSSICNTAFNLHIHICMYVPVRTYVPHIIFMANPLTSHYVCLFESYSKTYLGKYYLVTLVDWKILNIRIIVEGSTIGHNRKSWQERPQGLSPKLESRKLRPFWIFPEVRFFQSWMISIKSIERYGNLG